MTLRILNHVYWLSSVWTTASHAWLPFISHENLPGRDSAATDITSVLLMDGISATESVHTCTINAIETILLLY